MRRASFFLVVLLSIPAATFGQSASSDSQTLQALLREVRALHQDLQISLARVQAAQILLARLQAQQAAVTHASQRLDDARSKLTEVQGRQTHISANIQRLEDTLSAADENPALQKPELQGALDDLKSELEGAKNEEQQRQTAQIDAEQQLQTERDKLSTLEAQLDEIMKGLGNAGQEPGPVPR